MSDSEESGEQPDERIENGHFSDGLSPNFVSSDSDLDSDDVESENEIPTVSGEPSVGSASSTVSHFNKDAPTTHKYLGKLNKICGYTLFDDGEVLTILAVYTNTLVFPGFILPLVINNRFEYSVMQHFIQTKQVFVLLTKKSQDEIFNYGVTMEIYETDVRNNTLCLKARGRQRCQLVPNTEIKHLAGRLQKVTVKILPEYTVDSPIADTQLLALKSKRKYKSTTYEGLKACRVHRRYHLAQFSFPSWVYEQNEICYNSHQVLEGLTKFFPKEYIPQEPVKLSYWFIQNFLLEHEERLFLMKQKTVLDRLRLEGKFLRVERTVVCCNCKSSIAELKDVFVMSKDGAQSNYCNPRGLVFETITLIRAQNIQLTGLPSKQFSWFPGYSWMIIECLSCKQHLGWRFNSSVLQPHCFYGLAKTSFLVRVSSSEDDEGPVFSDSTLVPYEEDAPF